MKKTTDSAVDVTITSNPFEGLKNGDERLAKAKIAAKINALLKKQGLTQQQSANLLGVTQPEVSQLANGRLAGFTFDRLYRCLYALNMDVKIVLRKHRGAGDAGMAVSA